MVSARARRDQVDYAVGFGASVRRACALLQVSRSSLRYESRMVARDAERGVALEEIAGRNRGYGHRFAWAFLRRRGDCVNRKRVRRVWRALGAERSGEEAAEDPNGPGARAGADGSEPGLGL